jgi:hypothetical protein
VGVMRQEIIILKMCIATMNTCEKQWWLSYGHLTWVCNNDMERTEGMVSTKLGLARRH